MTIEEKYYHIDRLINKAFKLNIELKQTKIKRSETVEALEKVKERLMFLNRPNSGNLLLVEAFQSETAEKYRSLLSRIKAIDESIEHLQRSYDDTQLQALTEKRGLSKIKLETPLEIAEDLDTKSFASRENVTKYETFDPSQLISRDQWSNEEIIDSEVQRNENQRKPPITVPEQISKREKDLISSWVTKFDEKIPEEVLNMCSSEKCSVCNMSFDNATAASAHYNGRKHFKVVSKLLRNLIKPSVKLTNVSKSTSKDKYVPQRSREVDNMEAQMRELAEECLENKPWLSEPVLRFVETSVRDFQILLKWLEEAESRDDWNVGRNDDINFGLRKVHQMFVKNLQEIERNYKYLQHDREYVDFVSRFVRKPDQYILKAAKMSVDRLDTLYENTLQNLNSGSGLTQRIDRQFEEVWSEYHKERKKLKGIKMKISEVELHEERISELDDWREEPGHFSNDVIKEVCDKVDKQHAKVMSFTKADVAQRWDTVDKDLKKLQVLRVKALLTWLEQLPGASRPHWLCQDLFSYMEDMGHEYVSLEDAALVQGGWIGQSRNKDYDLMLDMAYTRLRTTVNRVKYARIENMRHRQELDVYQQWFNNNKVHLKSSTVSLLEDLMAAAGSKVAEADAKLQDYVASLETRDREKIRSQAKVLDKVRSGKREAMTELMQTLKSSWNKEAKQTDFVTFA